MFQLRKITSLRKCCLQQITRSLNLETDCRVVHHEKKEENANFRNVSRPRHLPAHFHFSFFSARLRFAMTTNPNSPIFGPQVFRF